MNANKTVARCGLAMVAMLLAAGTARATTLTEPWQMLVNSGMSMGGPPSPSWSYGSAQAFDTRLGTLTGVSMSGGFTFSASAVVYNPTSQDQTYSMPWDVSCGLGVGIPPLYGVLNTPVFYGDLMGMQASGVLTGQIRQGGSGQMVPLWGQSANVSTSVSSGLFSYFLGQGPAPGYTGLGVGYVPLAAACTLPLSIGNVSVVSATPQGATWSLSGTLTYTYTPTPPVSNSGTVSSGASATVTVPGAGAAGTVDAKFNNVTAAGTLTITQGITTAEALAASGNTYGAGPVTFELPTPGAALQVWDVNFTGTFAGTADLVFHFDPTGMTTAQEQALQVYHYTGGHWQAMHTVSRDLMNDTITVTTDSFSPFALGAADMTVVPPPAAVWSGLSLLGGLVLLRTWRATRCGF